ncbi:MAG: peptide deformylase [Bdellovibrionales bacterium]|nr:peptide deformylase [Bdellovibrionales bacterium]
MAIRKVARMGHPVLRQIARELTQEEILSEDTRLLVRDMIESMNEYGGIGIAAPQIYESVAVAVIDYQEEGEDGSVINEQPLTVVINPKIKVLDDKRQGFWEGCLSVPEIRGLVYRPRKVQIDYLDLSAKPQKIVAEGFLATVFQHELDHLFGTLFVDRVEYAPGKSPIAFTEEYQKYLTPEEDDDIGELAD